MIHGLSLKPLWGSILEAQLNSTFPELGTAPACLVVYLFINLKRVNALTFQIASVDQINQQLLLVQDTILYD